MAALFDQLVTLPTLVRAFDKVHENRGGPGSDSVTAEVFGAGLERNLEELREQLVSKTYRPQPLLRVYITNRGRKERPLSIPTVRDRVAQTAAAMVLTPILEPEFEDVSFAYRPRRSVDQALALLTSYRDDGYRWVVDADIKRYFDSIPLDPLLGVLATLVEDADLLDVIKLWLFGEVIEGKRVWRMVRGVAQGSPLSPLLANLYLDHMDEEFIRHGQRVVRFADDFVVVCRDRPTAVEGLALAERVLRELGLELNQKKTRITNFDQGFRFLGVEFVRSMTIRTEKDKCCESKSPLRTRGSDPAHVPTAPNPTTVVGRAFGEALQALPPGEATKRWTEVNAPGVVEEPEPLLPTSGNHPVLRTLYMMEQGAELGKEGKRFVIRKQRKVIDRIPALRVDQIILFGNVRVTTPAMHFCLLEGVPIFLLSSRGRYYGVVESTNRSRVSVLQMQFKRAGDPAFCQRVAQGFIVGKVKNQRTLLLRQARRTGDSVLTESASALKLLAERTSRATSLAELRGIEGAAASRYFTAWQHILSPTWGFRGRKRQPPPDPINSLLSYGYTLLFYNAYSLIRSTGLHPDQGFLHVQQRHPALVSDLIEEFRAPVVDSTVLALINRKQVRKDDFDNEGRQGKHLLTNEARKRVTKAFEVAFNRSVSHPKGGPECNYRRAIALQAAQLLRAMASDEVEYQPFLVR